MTVFIFNLIYSIFIFLIVFYIPGKLVLNKVEKKINLNFKLITALGVGLVLWALQGYVFGYLKLRFLTYPYLILPLLMWLKNFKSEISQLAKNVKELFLDKWLILIIITGLVISLAGVFPSGLPSKNGIWFYDINIIDGSYHLALINSIIRSIPPEEPGMAENLVTNYHYFSDLLLGEIIRVFKISPINIFYQYFPLLVSMMMGFSAYYLGFLINNSKITGRIMAFLMYFGGNLGYLVMLILTHKMTFKMASLDDGAILFTNPPRAVAQVIFLIGSILVFQWIKKKELRAGIIACLMLGTCVGFKVYVGIFAALGLVGLFIYFLIKKQWVHLLPIVLAGLLSALIFFPTNPNTGGLFFSVVSWPRHYFAQGEAVKLNWHLQEQTFKSDNNIKRLVILYTQMTLVFLVTIYGTRIIGIFWMKKIFKHTERGMFIYLLVPLLVSNFVALFFLQRSGPYEIFNFFAVSGVVLSLLTAIAISDLLNKNNKIINWCIIVIFVIITVPRSINQAIFYINQAYKQKNGAYNFSNEEIKIFNYMKANIKDDELVLSNIDDDINQYSPYVAALGGVRMYFAGDGVLRAHGLKTDGIKNEVQTLWRLTDGSKFAEMAKNRNIKYLFLRTGSDPKALNNENFRTIMSGDKSRLVEVIY